MSNDEIRQLLEKLQTEIKNTRVDEETRALVKQLDTDIHELLGAESQSADSDSVLKRARSLEANFASDHPTAERFMREVIDTLGKMGI